MLHIHHHRNRAGMTLVETMMYVCVAVILSYVTYSFLIGATTLYAKNMSIVHSHTNLRSVLDRITNNMQQGNSLPVLIDTNGNAVVTPPSAGLYYDRYLGDPYVLTNPSGTGLPAGTTTITVTRSTAPLASSPAPVVGDAIVISSPNGSSGNVRSKISAIVTGALDAVNQRQSHTLTLTTPLANAISWSSPAVMTATLVHREAFLVVPVGNVSEFRYFQNFEPMPVLTNSANYTVISNQLSILAGETTPFSIVLVGTDKIVAASFFARSTDYSTYLATKQAYEFNTFVRLNTSLSSRLRPQQ